MSVSDKIDSVVTNRFLALPIFAAVIFIVYYVSVTTVGTILTDWTNDTLFGEWIAPSAYFVGIAAIICSGIILKKTKMFAGNPAPFVMELPAYHLPTIGNVLRSTWERSW